MVRLAETRPAEGVFVFRSYVKMGSVRGFHLRPMEDKFQGRIRRSDILRAIALLALLACILTVAVSAGWLYAETGITIEKLERGFETTLHYLEDKGRALIRILNEPLPKPLPIGSEIIVTDPSFENAKSDEIFLIETKPTATNNARRRTRKHAQSPAKQPQEEPSETQPTEPTFAGSIDKQTKLTWLAIGAVLLILFMIGRRRIGKPRAVSSPAAPNCVRTPSPIPAALLGDHRPRVDDRSHVTEYKTAKILPGKPFVLDGRSGTEKTAEYETAKILPGKLIMLDGRNGGEETEVVYLTDQSGMGEVEIGRESPDVTGGIRIRDKANTLSRRQARLVYSAQTREFRLINLAGEDSNPTAINGRRMASNETVLLRNDDILEMGNIRLKFCQ